MGARVKLAKDDRTERENRIPETTASTGGDDGDNNDVLSSLSALIDTRGCTVCFNPTQDAATEVGDMVIGVREPLANRKNLEGNRTSGNNNFDDGNFNDLLLA
jgi:hypothetical protein